MLVDHDTLIRWPIPNSSQTYNERDVMLYALGLGIGHDPVDPYQLRYVYEKGLQTFPTFALTLGIQNPFFVDPKLGLNHKKIINVGVSAIFHRLLPTSGSVCVEWSVPAAFDKGDKGALIQVKRSVRNENGELFGEFTSTYLFRDDGHFGGPAWSIPTANAIPVRVADKIIELKTLPQAALIYRLSGDYNPTHADPNVAKAMGFPRPILHGLFSFGLAAYGILASTRETHGQSLNALEGRFSAPMLPGETFQLEMWIDGPVVSFRARSRERNVVAVDNGRAVITA